MNNILIEQFQECPECAAKPESPTLCNSCYERRKEFYAKQNVELSKQQELKYEAKNIVEALVEFFKLSNAKEDDDTMCNIKNAFQIIMFDLQVDLYKIKEIKDKEKFIKDSTRLLVNAVIRE